MTLTKRMNQWERDMANLKVTVVSNTELAKEANAKVDKVSKDVDEVVKSRKQDKANAINEATKRMSAELLEKGGKKNNAILYGLDEPPPLSVKGVDRKNSDLALIKDMFKEMEVKPEPIRTSSSRSGWVSSLTRWQKSPAPSVLVCKPLSLGTTSSRRPRTSERARTSLPSASSLTSRRCRGRMTRD